MGARMNFGKVQPPPLSSTPSFPIHTSLLFSSCLSILPSSPTANRPLKFNQGTWGALQAQDRPCSGVPAGSGAESRPQTHLRTFWACETFLVSIILVFLYEPKCCNWSISTAFTFSRGQVPPCLCLQAPMHGIIAKLPAQPHMQECHQWSKLLQ